jgi:tryptophanyl-tRNA synthetase
MPFEEIVVSGTRPTGNLHLGNYLGAVKQYVRMQEIHKCYFFIADYHSLTTHPNTKELQNSIKTVLVEYLACGLDPEKITIYKQSDLPQIPELYLILNMYAYLGELERVPTFKEKARSQPDNINAGLLTYPTLMAADILIHKGTKVPVGKDQEQHLEMTRLFARRFNNFYEKEVLPEPMPYNFGEELIKVNSLDAKGKMSKSGDPKATIYITESPEAIRKKMKSAVTSSGAPNPEEPMPEGVKNLFSLMSYFSSKETFNFFTSEYNNASIRYGDMKMQIADDLITYLTPIREKAEELLKNTEYLNKVLSMGADKAKESAEKVIKEVRGTIGI